MIKKMCPKHRCILLSDKCVEYDIDKNTGVKIACDASPVDVSALFWCSNCRVPSFYDVCPNCGERLEYLCADIRPVFPEEKLLLALLLRKSPECYQKSSVWCSGNLYIIDGDKLKVSVKASVDILKIYLDSIESNIGKATILIGPYGKGKSHLVLILLCLL